MRKQRLSLAKLTPSNKDIILDKVGGSTCDLGNPVDYWPPERFIGTKICEIYNTSSKTLLKDDAVDGLILALEFFHLHLYFYPEKMQMRRLLRHSKSHLRH